MLPAVQIPLLSPPLSINSPTQPVAPLDLAALSRQAAPPLTPESTPPVASALAAAARDRPSFFPSSLAPGFYDALLPEPAQAARARARSTVVEVVNARDGSIWTGALLEPEAAKAMALTSVDALESGAATGDELVLCVAVPTDAGVDIREGVEMIVRFTPLRLFPGPYAVADEPLIISSLDGPRVRVLVAHSACPCP